VKDERIYLGHIRDAINDIEQYASAGRDVFMVDRMRQDAVIRKLEDGRRNAARCGGPSVWAAGMNVIGTRRRYTPLTKTTSTQ